jgi:hypothetical protein
MDTLIYGGKPLGSRVSRFYSGGDYQEDSAICEMIAASEAVRF